MTDYQAARQLGKSERKPLAVFIGYGKEGWDKVTREKQLDDDARRILADSYVCVYVDSRDQDGKRLADAFEIRAKHGLALSDSSGDVMALRHEGRIAGKDLVKKLRHFSNPDLVVDSTQSISTVATATSYATATTAPEAPIFHYSPVIRSSGSC
jgi:hypothetical protein